MKRHSAKQLAIPFLTLSFLAGCAAPQVQMYDGPAKSAEEQAVVKAARRDRRMVWGAVGITHVDSAITVNPVQFLFNGGKWAGVVYVLPGKHTIKAHLDQGNRYADGDLWFVAEAGRSYVLRARAQGYGVQFWIEDESSGRITGGLSGSSDEPPQ